MDKNIFIKDITDGQAVHAVFLVRQMGQGETKAGKPYLMLTLMDRSGELAARVWDNAEALAPQCPAGGFVAVDAQAQAYKGVVQLKVNDLRAVAPSEVDPALFMPVSPANLTAMEQELHVIIAGLDHPQLRSLLTRIFTEPEFSQQFVKAPAAKHMHHACVGGLLEHTVAVARLALKVCDSYPELDRSLLVAGALLHDIGKTREFSFEVFPFDYSTQGRLMGHLVLGVEMVQAAVTSLADFPQDLTDRLKHLILSHHGRHEFGSPSLPMTAEAFVLNLIDDLDAKINYLNRLADQAKEPGYQWSEYQKTMERFLFVRGRAADETAPAMPAMAEPAPTHNLADEMAEEVAADTPKGRKQASLW